MNWLQEFLKRQREADIYSEMPINSYSSPKVKSVVTQTEGQPRKVTTTFDFPQGDKREIGSLSMGPLSMMSAERRGYDPMLMQSEPKIPYDEIFANQNRLRVPPYANVNANISGIDNAYTQRMGGAPLYNVEEAMKNVDVSRGSPFDVISNLADSASAIPNPLDAVGPVVNFLDKTGRGMVDAVLPEVGAGSDVVPYQREFSASPGDEGYIPDSSYLNNLPGPSERPRPALSLEGLLAPKEEQVLPPVKSDAQQVEERPILKEMYGKFARDPEARKQEYLKQLNKIYTNAMILNGIANLTGGQSQAGAYLKMATSKMDAIDKFDQEQRLQDIWKAIYFDQNGEYRAPGSWDKAFEMATVLGASPQEASEIASVAYKKPDRDEEKKSAYERLLDNAVASGLITEAEKSTAMRNKLGLGEDTQTLTALEKNIKSALASGAITQEQANQARKFALLGGKPGRDNAPAARRAMMNLYLARYKTQFGMKRNAPSFEKFLQDNMADYNALLYGVAAGAIFPTSSDSEMITGMKRVDERVD